MHYNSFDTGSYEGMIAETIKIKGYHGDEIAAYYSHPLSAGRHPGIVLIPHMPGWDEICREFARRFTAHGYSVICPDIYHRGGTGKPADISQKVKEMGGIPDKSVMGDTQCSIDYLREQADSNEKVGIIGMCSGGRHAFLAACTLEGIDAAVDCWGGGVTEEKAQSDGSEPVKALDYANDLDCPLLGIFGNDDKHPSPEEVNTLEQTLKELGKDYKFYRYDGAGHGIWYYNRDLYRPAQAMDSFEKVMDFFEEHLKNE